MQGCGRFPSPAISFEVSTMNTFFDSESILVASRTIVVFPVPGYLEADFNENHQHRKKLKSGFFTHLSKEKNATLVVTK